MPEAISLADALRAFRMERGLSLRALSESAELSPSYVGKLEAGEIGQPSLRSFLQVASALKLTQPEIMFCIRCALLELSVSPLV